MLPDLLKTILANEHGARNDGPSRLAITPNAIETDGTAADNHMKPDQLMSQSLWPDKGNVTNDAGDIVGWNEFSGLKDAIAKSRAGDNSGPGVLRQLLGSLLQGKMVPGTGTVGGDPAGVAGATHTPGTQQDAALNPTPMKDQSQPGMQRTGLLEKGNIDLNNRPVVQNDDGTISTVQSKSFNFGGKEVLLPTISDDGRHLSDQDAIAQYRATGKHLGMFGDINSANQYAQQLHEDQAKQYKYAQPSALDPVAIEQLRQSLLSDSGQLDPNNPNGISGRMNDPNSQIDINNQRKETQSIEDSVRGFDGSRKANIQKGNQ